jgi:hypothetical protein
MASVANRYTTFIHIHVRDFITLSFDFCVNLGDTIRRGTQIYHLWTVNGVVGDLEFVKWKDINNRMERDENGAGLSCVNACTTGVALRKGAVVGQNAVDAQRCTADVR